MPSQSLLAHLQSGGAVIGDGSFMFTLERRGFVKAGPWTPEVVVENPETVLQLSREFAHAGAMVIQACTFGATTSKLAARLENSSGISCEQINTDAVDIAAEAAKFRDAWVCGSITPTHSYGKGAAECAVKEELRLVAEIFVERKMDFLLAEFFNDIVEAEWAVDVLREVANIDKECKSSSRPAIGVTMRIGPTGDVNDVSPQECAVRLKKRGADIIGINCNYDPDTTIDAIKMKKLENHGLSAFLMTQPCGFHCQEVANEKRGFYALPEYPFALEPRTLTRIDAYNYARRAYEAGVRYVGGCCGFEPYHVRALALELEAETGREAPGKRKTDKWAESLKDVYQTEHDRVTEGYWRELTPAAGRKGIKELSDGLCKSDYK